jgi:transaldolase
MLNGKSTLRLYIDSVDSADWEKFVPAGVFYGVTTNPKLLAQSGIDFKVDKLAGLARSAFDLGASEIHLQVWGRETEKMLEVGRELGAIDQRVMVKVPINGPGILCARELISEGTNVTLTALHSARQALIAVSLGPHYAAPYLGRMSDGGLDGLEEVTAMHRIIQEMNSPLRLLVASIRQVSDLVTLARRGLNTFTLLPPLIEELLANELTDLAVDSFESAVEGSLRDD